MRPVQPLSSTKALPHDPRTAQHELMVVRVDRHGAVQDVAPQDPGPAREEAHRRRHLEQAQHSSAARVALQLVAERARGRNGDGERQNGGHEHEHGLHPLEQASDREDAGEDQEPCLEAQPAAVCPAPTKGAPGRRSQGAGSRRPTRRRRRFRSKLRRRGCRATKLPALREKQKKDLPRERAEHGAYLERHGGATRVLGLAPGRGGCRRRDTFVRAWHRTAQAQVGRSYVQAWRESGVYPQSEAWSPYPPR